MQGTSLSATSMGGGGNNNRKNTVAKQSIDFLSGLNNIFKAATPMGRGQLVAEGIMNYTSNSNSNSNNGNSSGSWVTDTANNIMNMANSAKEKLDTGAVEYTYKDGDTFGQVLLDLGLSTPENLWGEDGDIAYYTKQLNSQGITGNIPVGTSISLLPRKR